mgnify:CR=1 FL=1
MLLANIVKSPAVAIGTGDNEVVPKQSACGDKAKRAPREAPIPTEFGSISGCLKAPDPILENYYEIKFE